MDAKLQISLDRLPVKRLEAIEENGLERFPTDVEYDEKRVSLIRRIDFAWAVEKEDEEKKKKRKKSSNESSSATQWPWQSMVENLQAAQQELSVIIDIINTVEANDAVTVASMNRPKLLPSEHLADLAVSTATKLQCYRHLGKYFKQSAKALEQQIAREARFYGALIRLQKNWKVKWQRMAAIAPGSEGFTIDLFDNTLYDSASLFRPSSLSTIRIDHNSAGMLAINLPPNSCRSLQFGFLGVHSDDDNVKKSTKIKRSCSAEHLSEEIETDSVSDNEFVKETHSLLREVHQAIFSEQVFDMVNREAFNQSLGLSVTGIRENNLQLSISEDSVFISLVPSNEDDQTTDGGDTQISDSAVLPLDSLEGVKLPEEKLDCISKKSSFPNRVSCEIYLLQIFHENIFARAKDRALSSGTHVSGQTVKDGSCLLGHFCMSVAHRIFSNKVLMGLENAVCKVPYLHLISHPTWHSRISSWTVLMKVPHSMLHASSQLISSDVKCIKGDIKTEFRTNVVVNDDCIVVEAEGAPNVLGLFKGSAEDICSMNKYDCDLADLPVIILQQVASQVIRWLYEEAVTVGMKATRDFLSLSLELEQGEILSLVGHVDPEDTQGCISWWMVMEDSFAEERKLRMDIGEGASEYRKYLGYLPLEVLHSTMMDLVSLCNGGGSC